MNSNCVDLYEYTFRTPGNLGYLRLKLPEKYLQVIKKEVDFICSNRQQSMPMNERLAGQLKHEYEMFDSRDIMEPLLRDLSRQYVNHFGDLYEMDIPLLPEKELKFQSMWVNFQSKHEYNPPHRHSGLFSFALWIKIPYDIQNELQVDSSKYSIAKTNSCFSFLYTDILGNIKEDIIPVDKSMEGEMVFFPSTLLHHVYPFFTSDEERISVSGNLELNYANKK